MNPGLRTILLRDNGWLREPETLHTWLASHLPQTFVPRSVLATHGTQWRRTDRAHLVVGPRQAGKSTAVWAHLTAEDREVLFIDCEQALVQEWCGSAPLFLEELESVIDRPVALFFEEVQHLSNAGIFLKGIVDRRPGVPLLVTGSSSYHLGARVRESLAGRASRSRLLPFALAEVTDDLAALPPAARDDGVLRRWQRHVVVGGYPDAWLSERPEDVVSELLEAVILRDASDLHRIARLDVFRRLLELAANQGGQLVNLAEWAAIVGVSSDTVGAYLEILEGSHVLARLRPFAGGRRSELTRAPKVYFVDSGIRNQLVNDLRPLSERADAGAVVEGWVFSELWKLLPAQSSLHYWRSTSKAEVDFVLRAPHKLVAIEVKAGRVARATLPRAARSFIEAYQPDVFFLVSQGIEANDHLGTTRLVWLHPAALPHAVAATLADDGD